MSERVEIGNPMLYCGDGLAIAPTLTGIEAVVTDPPYGIKAKTDNRDRARRLLKGTHTTARAFAAMVGDDRPFDPSPWLSYPYVILWGGNPYFDSRRRC